VADVDVQKFDVLAPVPPGTITEAEALRVHNTTGVYLTSTPGGWLMPGVTVKVAFLDYGLAIGALLARMDAISADNITLRNPAVSLRPRPHQLARGGGRGNAISHATTLRHRRCIAAGARVPVQHRQRRPVPRKDA